MSSGLNLFGNDVDWDNSPMDLDLELDASEANGPRLGGVMEEEGEEEGDD